MTVTTGLPAAVIKEDRALEERASGAAVDLCKLRWHWTLDESNPGRVSTHEYARQVGVAQPTVFRDAQAFALIDSGAAISVNDARERAMMNTETLAAAEVVAKHHGVKIAQARKEHRAEITRVRDTARDVAEDQGTSTIEEIPATAEFMYDSREVSREQAGERRRRTPLRILETEAAWTRSYKFFLKGVRAIEGVDLTAEERELLRETADNLRRLLVIADRALADRLDRTWISDLQVIEGGKAS